MFDYFAVLISVILGLALTHVLRSMGSSRRRLHALVSVGWLMATLGYLLFIPLMSRIVGC